MSARVKKTRVKKSFPAFHIGQLVKSEVKRQQLPAKAVAEAINVEPQTVYRLYNDVLIDPDTLIKLSAFLKVNFFLVFREHEALKDLPDPLLQDLQKEVAENKALIATQHQTIQEKHKRIHDLEQIIAYQKKEIDELEKRSSTL